MTEPELASWGERLGSALRVPILVTLAGELGTGKTTLVRAICRGLGVKDEVTSPTFALVHEYASPRGPVYHLDLYRLEAPTELTNIGWDEIVSSHAVVLVEWPERGGDRVPRDHIPIRLEHIPADPDRRLVYAGGDTAYEGSNRALEGGR
jgi:tRNA threonylcarbamoyladenosine biosynthesis protein TsaE